MATRARPWSDSWLISSVSQWPRGENGFSRSVVQIYMQRGHVIRVCLGNCEVLHAISVEVSRRNSLYDTRTR